MQLTLSVHRPVRADVLPRCCSPSVVPHPQGHWRLLEADRLRLASRVTTEWMEGESGKPMPDFLNGRDAVVWARTYSAEDPERCDCDTLQTALGMVPGADRMVRLSSAGRHVFPRWNRSTALP